MWRPFIARTRWRSGMIRVLVGASLTGIIACGTDGGARPTAPSPSPGAGDRLLALAVMCQPDLLIGERSPCIAVASHASGRQPLVSFDSVWSSSRPEVVAVDGLGVSTGRSAGEATVTATYQERQASTVVVVTEQDALRIASGQGQQGDFTPGSTVTLWLQGYYSVASAPTGRLSLKISDQRGTITATAPSTVARGGDFFSLSTTFVVPDASIEVCRTAVLEVGSVTIEEPRSRDFPLWCIPIRRSSSRRHSTRRHA